MDALSTGELVRLVCAGQPQAFEQLVIRYEQIVSHVVVRRIGDRPEARDLVQEVFLKAYCKLPQLRDPERFGGWVRQIADRTAINYLTRRRNEQTGRDGTLGSQSAGEGSPLEQLLRQEVCQQVRRGLNELSEIDYQVLHAYYYERLSVAQIAEAFDRPEGTIKRRLHSARRRLQRKLAHVQCS